ncbi:MAG: putative 4-mercaptohistidine N1-methyltransferase [Verrucomicrobia bacterium]|nr:putative 4-mercaptohistidine N1-methyltransferase [Verrucomicrobiota bacterium]
MPIQRGDQDICSFYETDAALGQYLLLHYGDKNDQMPYPFGPAGGVDFPVRCASDCLIQEELPSNPTALDLGCAVGRTSFELSRFCLQVTGVDYSSGFISVAREIQNEGSYQYMIKGEGILTEIRTAHLPKGASPDRVQFVCADAVDFAKRGQRFDAVLACNLICRLPAPRTFLMLLKDLVNAGGQLVLTSPYSWLEEYTPRPEWLGGNAEQGALNILQEILNRDFSLMRSFDMPFLIREHLRKYQWGVAQATIWKRKPIYI